PCAAPPRGPPWRGAGADERDRPEAEHPAQISHRDAVADDPRGAGDEPARAGGRLLARPAARADQLWRDRPPDPRLAWPAPLRKPARLRALPQLRHRGRVPAPPGDADGPGRDRADSRRTQPRRSGAGRHVRLMKRVAIAGGGASGALLAVNLLRHTGAEVVLIERGPRVARGAAYGTDDPNHLLNGRAD